MLQDKPKIVLVGGGSAGWSLKLIRDCLLTPALENAHYAILDIDKEAGIRIAELGKKLAREWNIFCVFNVAANQKDAYTGADFVIITISTGGFDAMAYDLHIPEEYGIYQTVGDSVGPGGWARGLRNIQVFARMARTIEENAPGAVVLNYTNPMAVLTKIFSVVSSLKTVGLCHGLFEVYDQLINIFDLESEKEIKVCFGGTNHFFWILDMTIRGEDGYKLLRNKLNGRSFDSLLASVTEDEAGFASGSCLCSEFFNVYGYLPYTADRHICEFVKGYLILDEKKLEKYRIKRTSITDRKNNRKKAIDTINSFLKGESTLEKKRSRETAADIMSAIIENRDFIDVVNLPNQGQIPNLPMGSIVETLGSVNRLGFTPLMCGDLPEQILSLVLPHVQNQDMIAEGGLEGNIDQALWALYNDPLCSHLTLPEIKEMGMRLLKAHREYLPQFEAELK